MLGSESEMEMLYLGRRTTGGQDTAQPAEQPVITLMHEFVFLIPLIIYCSESARRS